MLTYAVSRPDWYSRRSRLVRIAVPLLFGVGIGLGQSPVSQPFISMISLFLMAAVFRHLAGLKPGLWFGWLVGSGYFASTMFWIVDPFMVEPAKTGWMAPFALIFLAGGLALFWAAGFGLAAWIGRTPRARLVALIVTLGLAELARAYVLTGFPWGLLAYIWVGTPFMQLDAYIGPHGVGAVTLGLAILPLLFKRRLLGAGVAAVIFALIWGAGMWRLSIPVPPRPTPVRLRLIQPNAAQNEKWEPKMALVFLQRQIDLTESPSKIPPNLVIWPETAVPFWWGTEPQIQRRIAESAPPGARIILGARRFKGRRIYNSMVFLSPDGRAQSIYDKAHLVPFGEYIPFGGFLARFGIYGLAANQGGGFTPGKGGRLMNLGALGDVRPLICYEAIFPQEIKVGSTRADWILQITNDAWFGTLAGPEQHLMQARARAIEQGLPFVRAANTGISAVIDAKGRVIASLPLDVAGKLDALLPGSLPPTLYSRTGDTPFLILFLLGLVGLVTLRRRN